MKNLIKVFAFLFTFSFALFTQAQEVQPPVGGFAFRGQLQLLLAKKSELIPTSTPAGQTRIAELRKLGWACTQKNSQMASCTVHSKTETLPSGLAQQIQQKYSRVQFFFGALRSIQLINDSESLREFDVAQDVRLNQSSTQNYRLQQLKDGPTKMQFDFSNIGKVYLNQVNPKTIAAVDSYKTSSASSETIYYVQVHFSK